MKKKKALIAASLLSSIFAAATYVEGTGYALLDSESSDNLLCKIDTTCRQMKPDEIKLAQKYFGASINYSTVKIFNRAWAGILGRNKPGISANGNIYFADEEDRSENFAEANLSYQRHFIHELVHVAQHQSGDNLPLEALMTYLTYEFKYKDAYDYRIDTGAPFHLLNLEQQAEIMEDYFIQRSTFEHLTTYTSGTGQTSRLARKGNSWMVQRCEKMAQFEEKLQQRFPIKPDELCQKKLAPPELKYAP